MLKPVNKKGSMKYLQDPMNAILSGKSSILGWTMVLLFVGLNASGALVLKMQIQHLGSIQVATPRLFFSSVIAVLSSLRVLLAIGALFAATIAWMIALANLELSRAYPVAIGLQFLTIMSASMLWHGESLTILKTVGLLLLLLGIIFLLN